MSTVSRRELADWFLPHDVAVTESLVRISGLNRLRELTQLTTYLATRPDFRHFRREALATLEELEREPLEVTLRRLGSPIFRGWLSGFGGVREFNASDPVLARQLVLWRNMRYSLAEPGEFIVRMAVVEGCCMTWDPRVALRVGDLREVVVQRSGLQLRVQTIDGATLLDLDRVDATSPSPVNFATGDCEVLLAPRLPASEIVIRNDLPLLHLKLVGPEREDGVAFGDLDHAVQSYGLFDPAPFRDAATILCDVWPEEYNDFRATLQVVVPRESPPKWRARGMTVSSHQGAIWIFVRDVLDLVEHMVHEQGHVKLRYIEEASPILAQDQTKDRFAVGWRKDPRPIVGIYEGVYVHLHVIAALVACEKRSVFSGQSADRCSNRIKGLVNEVREGLAILGENGRFTEDGRAYLDWAWETLEDYRGQTA